MQLTKTALKYLVLSVGGLSLLAAVGCGTGGSPSIVHTTGSFSNSTLSGSYVYQVHGVALVGGTNFVPYREVGVFTADGSGNITAGTDDSSLSAAATSVTGVYSIASDGTGSISFNSSSFGIPINFAITVASSSQVQLIENDTVLFAGGTADLQDATAAGTTPSGTFVFRLHQEQSAQNSSDEASQVGAFSVSGGSGSGAMDQNLNGTLTSPNLTISLNAPSAGGRGTGVLTDTTANFLTDFVYYVVSSGKLALLVDNSNAVGSGSAEAQSGVTASTGLSGTYAFGSRGDDFTNGVAAVAAVGQFTATSGALTGTQDTMQDGNYAPSTSFPSTCYTAGAAGGINGRVVATAGSGTPCSGITTQIFWMVSPSRAFFLNNTGLTFEDGTADLQTVSSFTPSTFKGQFAIGMDGVDLVDGQLLSRVGAFQLDGSSSASLSEDASGSLSGVTTQGLTGNYTVGSNGRVVCNLSSNSLDLVMYAISGSQAYVMQQDGGFITSGTITLQQ